MNKVQIIVGVLAILNTVSWLLLSITRSKVRGLKAKMSIDKEFTRLEKLKLEEKYVDKLSNLIPKLNNAWASIQESKKKGENQIYFINGEVPIEILETLAKSGYQVKYEQSRQVGSPSRIFVKWNTYPILSEDDIRNLYKNKDEQC